MKSNYILYCIAILFAFVSAERYEIFYDDGSAEIYYQPGLVGWELAEWFTPTAYPCTLTGFELYPRNTHTVRIKIWDDDGADPGPPRDPGTVLFQCDWTPAPDEIHRFVTFTFNPLHWLVFTSGDFYIGWQQINPEASAYENGFNTTPPNLNRVVLHWEIMGTPLWSFLYEVGDEGDLLIRALIGSGLKVLEPGVQHPDKLSLKIYPNPFNSSLSINYTITKAYNIFIYYL